MDTSEGFTFYSHSVTDTVAFGRALAHVLPAGIPIALLGEMGAGKTHFCKGLAAGIGVTDLDAVTSPTFTLHHTYQGTTRSFHHIDLHRVAGASEIPQEVIEVLDDDSALVAVEWADRFFHIWPSRSVTVVIEHGHGDERRIVVRARGFDGKELFRSLAARMA